MAAKDKIHDQVKHALIKEGWTITHDPFTIEFGSEFLYADLGAERVLAAERGQEKIVVECKSFLSQSIIQDFKEALGQYVMYLPILRQTMPEYKLYLAIDHLAYSRATQRNVVKFIMEIHQLPLIVINAHTAEVAQWIN